MRRPPGAAIAIAAALLAWAVTPAWAAPRATHDPVVSARDGRLLDVPFLPQTEDLCGGAAAAMVLRYWGADRVQPDDFAALVDRTRAGIAADVLTSDVRRRGWQALPFQPAAGDGLAWIREHVDAGRPVVALIAVGPSRFHYVVVVAATAGAVVVHDPARAPFRVLPRQEFDDAWAASGRWALLILPAAPDGGSTPPIVPTPIRAVTHATTVVATTNACTPLVHEMVARAKAGDLSGAASGLETATALCPTAPDAWRELAGIRFLQSRWTAAVSLAARATALAPADEAGWDLLASSQYLDGRSRDALASWNLIGRPEVDVVRVTGARRTRHPVVADALALPPRSRLTRDAFDRASRRLAALPAAAMTALRYRPMPGGQAEVEATIVERPLLPTGRLHLAAALARMAIQREARLDVASPTGGGELWSAAWRFWDDRPRLSFALALPGAGGLPGVATVDGLWERASYAGVVDGAGRAELVRQERRRAAIHLADWATSRLRWRGGVALDRWTDEAFGSLDLGLDLRLAGDRLALATELAGWASPGGRRFAHAGVAVTARTHTSVDRAAWHLAAGLAQTTPGAPFDLWNGAGLGRARAPLLRAHPLLEGGVVSGPIFGRRLAHATLEYTRPVVTWMGGAVSVAAFADTARAWQRVGPGPSWQSDAGLGARLALPGEAGTLRVDLARGLRDAAHVLSAGWSTSWPAR